MAGATPASPYHLVDVPVAITRGDRLAYVNPALTKLLGVAETELVGRGSAELFQRFVPARALGDAEQSWSQISGGAAMPELWTELSTPRGTVLVCVRMQPMSPGENLFVLLDVPGMEEARSLTEALARGTGQLLACSGEREVLQRAADLVFDQGMVCTTLLCEGDRVRHGPLRHDPGPLVAVEKMYGRSIHEVDFPRSAMPHMDGFERTRSATFHPDAFVLVERIHPPHIVAYMRTVLPRIPVVDAPIFVEGRLYGALAAFGPRLSPATGASIELFAQLVGSAIEAVRGRTRAEERLRELERLQRELVSRERLAALGEAAAVVSHEVRNPIGAMLNAVAVLKREQRLSANGAQVVQILDEEAHRLDRLVADLLDFARPLTPRLRQVELRALAEKAVAAMGAPGHVQVEVTCAEGVAVDADPELLHLALTNLVRNAVQASPRGGQVRVSGRCDGGKVLLQVDDQGPGIRDSDVARIFEPFFTTRAVGTGLGLAVVDRVATLHGASVEVGRSDLGGARFVLVFPEQAATERPVR